jgi:ligand-binding sensor protein
MEKETDKKIAIDENITDTTVNSKVNFSSGKVAQILRKLEKFLGIPLSLRSTTGEVVCKTDYFYGPCSYIRGTEIGCKRCRKVYANIERKILRRKVSYVCLCYCGFLIFAVPLEFRGEMVGILIGSQILSEADNAYDLVLQTKFANKAKELGLNDNKDFFNSFDKIKFLKEDSQKMKFLSYIEEIGKHFVEMAVSGETWKTFLREIKSKKPEFGVF